ncbi:MAG TPA: DUF1566 domain-containing protein [Polyangia bacterium]|nr:DUF1566 domain-containing protein [Polyangia bacterium]
MNLPRISFAAALAPLLVSCGGQSLTTVPRAADAGAPTPACHAFPMPNPPSSGLPHPQAYTALDDGTVRDEVTGLLWQRAVTNVGISHEGAIAACAAKGEHWRLPTRLELLTLVDFTVGSPGPTIAPVFPDTPPEPFWSASLYKGDLGDAWTVSFDIGYSDYGVRNADNLVRCVNEAVSSCPVDPVPAADGDPTHVTDRTTGLTWQQTLDPRQFSWDDAAKYCAGLGAGWRVPSLLELQTIIDDGYEYPAVVAAAFPNTPSEDFWTSTPLADTPGTSWYVDFFYGATDRDVNERLFRVRCVR